jgi:hypothetical protein
MKRSVLARSMRFSGTVSLTEKREEIVAVLKAITELGGEVMPTDLVGYLIPEGLEAAADRLLVIAAVHGLVEQVQGRFRLTDAGAKARDVGQVLVPRDGTWQVWITSDPLIRFSLLHVEATRPGEALSELRETGGRRSAEAQTPRTMPVPALLRELHRVEGRLMATEGRVVRIDELGREVSEESSDAQVELVWTLGSDGTARMAVRGVVNVRRGDDVARLAVDTALPAPGVAFTDVFNQLLDDGAVSGRWDTQAAVLRCEFDDRLDPAAIQSMHRTVTARRLDLSAFGLGFFDKVTVPDVPIAATDAAGAERWSMRRLLMGIQDHQTTSRYEAVTEEATRPFAEFAVKLPDRATLLRQVRNKLDLNAPRPELYWRLQAAADWSL